METENIYRPARAKIDEDRRGGEEKGGEELLGHPRSANGDEENSDWAVFGSCEKGGGRVGEPRSARSC